MAEAVTEDATRPTLSGHSDHPTSPPTATPDLGEELEQPEQPEDEDEDEDGEADDGDVVVGPVEEGRADATSTDDTESAAGPPPPSKDDALPSMMPSTASGPDQTVPEPPPRETLDPSAFQDVNLSSEAIHGPDTSAAAAATATATPSHSNVLTHAPASTGSSGVPPSHRHPNNLDPPRPPLDRNDSTTSSVATSSTTVHDAASTSHTSSPQPNRTGGARMRRSSTSYSARSASISTAAGGSTAARRPLLQGVLVVTAFETILNSKDARKNPALKAAAQRALDILRAPASNIGGPGGAPDAEGEGKESREDRRGEVLEALKLACETKTNALMITALDAIGKLVSYGFFNPPLADGHEEEELSSSPSASPAHTPHGEASTGEAELGGSSSKGDPSFARDVVSEQLSDTVVDTICNCFIDTPSGPAAAALQAAASSTATPDAVNLQIVKALLTLVLSDQGNRGLSVHQSSLLKAVRTVYNIFLLSRNPTNQMVAQGALNQIVGSVFARVRPDPKLANMNLKERESRPSSSRTTSRAHTPAAAEGETRPPVNGESQSSRDPTARDVNGAGSDDTVETLETQAEASSEHAPTSTEAGGRASEDTVRPNDVEEKEGPTDTTEPPGVESNESEAAAAAELTATEKTGPVPAIVEPTQDNAATKEATPDARPEPLNLKTMQSAADLHEGARTPGPETPQPFFSLNELHTKDAYLVFRALCKLGMKPLGVESERDMKSHAMRSKLLSLHLILSILHSHPSMFVDPNIVIYSSASREFTPFIQAVKQYLLLCLSRNAVSPVLSVFELSCEIFWRVLSGMRTKLKKEIEVLLNEIFLPILEMRNSSVRQKAFLLTVFSRLWLDPQALVEIYINYDCDRTSLDNVYERLVNIISRIGTTHFTTSTPSLPPKEGKEGKDLDSSAAGTASWTTAMPYLPAIPSSSSTTSLSMSAAGTDMTVPPLHPPLAGPNQTFEAQLKRQSLDCLVSILRSLVAWAGRIGASPAAQQLGTSEGYSAEAGSTSPSGVGSTSRNSEDDGDRSMESPLPHISNGATGSLESLDDPGRFETAKMRKTTLLEGIRKFNFKPKRGIDFLIENGFIRSCQPKDIAIFLLNADGLSKAMIGEYLGEGDPESVATMHAFVDLMDFSSMKFTDALRMFLQSFRLPGEAQKIDRYMLKFAERFMAGNPSMFANADTAYILAFSTIMLNTDAHSPQIKKGRMTKADFMKNNRGINNGEDLPEEVLSNIYDEIQANEIRMKDEVEAAAGTQTPSSGLANALSNVGRDLQREAYALQSEGMANKTEALFRTMVRTQRRGGASQRSGEVFFSATAAEHVRPMFEVVWMPLLAGISGPLQTSEEMDVIDRSLEGFKQAIKIVCLFDLELERNAFVTTLAKSTFLNDYGDMRRKNVEAIRCMLDVAAINGNYLKASWREVIICVSQLERFQLITQGVDSRAVPELGRKHSVSQSGGKTNASKSKTNKPTEEVASEMTASHIANAADRIFASSMTLSGTAIVDFVRALSEVSWEEIQSSGLAEHPRVFCLQKLVEISYYNMGRIRLEWSQMWSILGEHFNQVCCHTNANVSFLALDSLRQLAMRFLEKQELANFNFQKDFLKPFAYAMVHNNNPDVRDMILSCLQQMIQARVANLRSGWRTMFGVFCAASKVLTERVANQAFDIVKRLNRDHFSLIITYGSFADLAVCITDFCKISKYQKISLHAIEMLRGLIGQMIKSPECPITADGPPPANADNPADDPMTRYWFPVLFGFYDIIMNGEDLEVRKRALDYLFDTLKTHGRTFPPEFWDSVCKEVLFPIFAVLRSRQDVSRFSTHEDMSVWLSTTMIQALRDLVDLFAHYFDVLVRMLDQLLDLLVECICQENDTLARIGTSCLQQLLETNVRKLTPPLWEKIVTTFVQLFQTTTASQLFDENLRMPLDPDAPESPSENSANANGFIHPTPLPNAQGQDTNATRPLGYSERRRIFRQIIVKCVLQLLLIETAHDLLQNEEVYSTIPPADLLRLMAELDHSYRFAKRFNADKDLRMALWKVGFMKQLPNLLKQESSSAATLVNVLLRMYSDTRPDHVAKRGETLQAFLPLGVDILEGYISLDPETQARNISAWTPVVAEVLQGICSWEDDILQEHVSVIYPLAVDLMAREMTSEIRESVRSVFHRIGLTLNIFQAEGSVVSIDDESEETRQ